MTQIGMSQTQIDAIELRLLGADHRPWAVSRDLFDESGRPLIIKASRKSVVKAEDAARSWDDSDVVSRSMMDGIQRQVARDPRSGGGKPPNAIDHRLYVKALALFKLCDEASNDMAEFVANAPADIEVLVHEVQFLKKRLRDAEVERDEMKKDLLALRVSAAAAQERFSEQRKLLRELGRAIKDAGTP